MDHFRATRSRTSATRSRTLRSTPVVSAVAVLSLALGIGANTAIFSILDSLILRPLPVRDRAPCDRRQRPAGAHRIDESRSGSRFASDGSCSTAPSRGPTSVSTWHKAARQSSSTACGRAADLFDVLGVRAILGRTFTDADDRRGGGPDGPVAVIRYAFWQRRFSGAADVVGRTLTVEHVPFTIVGVTPPDFFGVDVGRTFDVAMPHRHRAAAPRKGIVARSAIVLVARRDGPAEARSERRRPATPRCAAVGRRSGLPRCRKTGVPKTRPTISGTDSR